MPRITTACLNSPMPLRLNALLCRSYTCPCQCSATPLVCYSMPKPSSAHLRLALAPFFFSMPSLCISSHCPHIPLLCQNHAPFSHGNTLPGPFIAIQCPYFAMPVLTSRCSASATRHLAFAQLIFAVPCSSNQYPCAANPCFAISIPNKAITNLYGTLQSNALTIRFIAPAHLGLALPYLSNSLPCLYCSIPQHQSSTSHSKAPLPLFRHWPRPL